MKIKDLKAGVLYAYQDSKYSGRKPVILLDVEHSYTHRSRDAAGTWTRRDDRTVSLHGTYGLHSSKTGFLAVVDSYQGYDNRSEEVRAAARDRMQQQAARILRNGLRESFALKPGAEVRLDAINPRFIVGEWDDVEGAAQIALQAAQERRAALDAESAARVAAATARVEALRALALPGDIAQPEESWSTNYGGTGMPDDGKYSAVVSTRTVRLTLDQVDALLSLIPAGARYVEPEPEPGNVADDGWSYAEPEGVGEHVQARRDEEPEPQPEPEPARVVNRKPRIFAKFTAYLGHSGVSGSWLDAAGAAKHVAQADIALVAPTKADAVAMLVGRGESQAWAEQIVSEMRTHPWDPSPNDLRALVQAGLLTAEQPRVLVWATHSGGPVAEALPGGGVRIAGRFEHRRGADWLPEPFVRLVDDAEQVAQ